jgi:DNA-binding SARP family transcriptional activator
MQGSPDLQLRLFDFWRLAHGRQIVHVPTRSRRLLALLALHGRQPRVLVAGTLWPDADERHAQLSLRAALSALHRDVPGIVQADNGEVELAEDVFVDVHEFRGNVHRVLSGWIPDLSAVVYPSTLIGGELLPGWYDEWVLAERERIHQERLYVLEALAGRLVQSGAYAQALEVALKAVEIDQLRESARRSVIQVHLAEGNAATAVREYQRFRSMLNAELDVEPTHQLTELMQQVIEHR